MKGSVLDLPIVMAVILVFAISIIVSTMAVTTIRDTMSNQSNVPNITNDLLDEGVNTMHLFDSVFVLFSVGVAAAVIIGALAVNTHPAFFIFTMILNVIMALIGSVFTNVYDAFATSTGIATYANEFPMILTFMRNFPIFIFVTGLIVGIVMYSVYQPGGGRA